MRSVFIGGHVAMAMGVIALNRQHGVVTVVDDPTPEPEPAPLPAESRQVRRAQARQAAKHPGGRR